MGASRGGGRDLSVEEGQKGVEIAVVERPRWAEEQLHVLLRHRLVLEAEVGERTLVVEVDDEPRHLAVSNVKQARARRLHLCDV